MKTADARLNSLAQYKRNFDSCMRQFNTELKTGEQVFVKLENATKCEGWHIPVGVASIVHQKLRPKALGPYQAVALFTSNDTIIRNGLAEKL